ncbi:Ldh family oxidoreductase [Jiella pelagia]|uniref:Ldh family oxidoreductase n=1 Tax=Jiella pelagia TaxID=2986949 RepID=A0ABY7C7N0_9HYPH|nr:Ldh family oxidoreductase [Jiella pelagia]WAP69815.1 Ldh family oxidoreductase [Jiella pelagia]
MAEDATTAGQRAERETIDLPVATADAKTVRVQQGPLRALVETLLVRLAVPAEDAGIVARSLVASDLRGMNSHGVLRLPVYLRRLRTGGVNPNAEAKIVRETDGTALLDGDAGLGSVLTAHAMEMAIGKAKGRGIGAVGVRNSNHNGEGAFYASQAIEAGMIGIATTNASPIMPAWGGTTPITGPLPITIGVPTGRHPPIIFDAALGMSSRGKILQYAEEGRPLPDGWLVDKDGRPTNDPEWVRNGGWILPIGGHKGWGLILACEILTGVLMGGAFGTELTNLYDDLDTPQRNSHFVLAIDVSAFLDPDAFRARMDGYVDLLKASAPAPGSDGVRMPGEREHDMERDQGLNGIALQRGVLQEIVEIANEMGVTVHVAER